MKVIQYHEHGGPDVLRYEDIDDPVAQHHEVIVDIKACSVNHLDIWLRKGIPGVRVDLPRIPGADGAGVVSEVGSEITSFKMGDRVVIKPQYSCGTCPTCLGDNTTFCQAYGIYGEHSNGMYAERKAVPAHRLYVLPETMSFESAAAAPLVSLTAWAMIVTKARVQPGETVLILGAGAGVGTACIQIARLCGAHVWVTAGSDEKLAKAEEMGAEVCINYNKEHFAKKIRELTNKRGVDVVVDYIGKDTWMNSILSLRRGGRLVTCGATTGHDPVEDLRHVFYRQLTIHGSTMGSDAELHRVMQCVFDGRIQPIIDRTLPLKDASEAHRVLENREAFGKIVLTSSSA